MKQNLDQIPLKTLICDGDSDAATSLQRALEEQSVVLAVDRVGSTSEAQQRVRSDDYNTIFIDPLTLGLDQASSFIFEVRKSLPEIVFVLYVDRSRAERQRASFYRGERERFSHYYTLDKQTPVAAFVDEVQATVRRCQSDLSWRMAATSLERLQSEAEKVDYRTAHQSSALLKAVDDSLSRLAPRPSDLAPRSTRTVFLSHRFAEEEYVNGLMRLLDESGFEVITGKSSNTYVGRSVIDRIREASFFLCLMTKADSKTDGTFTTSPWLLEEKGVALAFSKPLVLMVEERGVGDILY
ncbi:hypothetical protein Paes_2149 [Prosthecochloris aestuarii DSM 271]|uniref:TIR domain-containing protein n=1 Tax=Prosthecochloris aestuarii (strain DSM 271 / SK 413) TaxID=290512 RepID=B4S5V5_PROA2|nr:hypothetical protein [Prosthecochloris aestuarii]ACF47152.1 hypothetical protein Paes_2149 [Prosthecochloris aestuarii DSM 271]